MTLRASLATAVFVVGASLTSGVAAASAQTKAQRAAAGTGDSLYSAREWGGAAAEYERVISADDTNPWAWYRLSLALHASERWSDAVRAHLRTAEFPQYRVPALFNLARAHARLGANDHALDALERSIAWGFRDLSAFRAQPDLDDLRDDPRYQAIEDQFAVSVFPPIIDHASWSPDGTRIVFSAVFDGSAGFDLFTLGADGTDLRRVTRTLDQELKPDWSPDGERIVYQRLHAYQGRSGIYTIRPDGTGNTAVIGVFDTTIVSERLAPSWMPDGERVAFVGGPVGNREIFAIDVDGSNLVKITDGADSKGAPDVSPSGVLAFDVKRTRDSYNVEILEPGAKTPTVAATDEWWYGPDWSPDGTRLAASYFESGVAQFNQVAVVNADGTDKRVVTPDSLDALHPQWSPDGLRLLFVSSVSGFGKGGQHLFTIGVDGTDLQLVFPASRRTPDMVQPR